MPVYHFTLHAYGSWSPAHPRGYVRRREGILPSDAKKAELYKSDSKWPRGSFTDEMQHVLILGCADVCANRGWRLHAVATEPSHVHLIVSWKQFIPWQEVRQRIKNVLSYLLGRVMSQNGRQWFVREGSRKRVLDREHFDHLIRQYFPRHRGLSWREGEALPEDRWGILGARRSKTRGLPSAAMKDGRDESRRQQIQ